MSDELLEREVSPGKNRVLYLLGHLAAVHDAMLPLLMIGERSFAHLDDAFLANPDKAGLPMPGAAESSELLLVFRFTPVTAHVPIENQV